MGLGGSAVREKTAEGLQSGMGMQLNLQRLPSKCGILGRTPTMLRTHKQTYRELGDMQLPCDTDELCCLVREKSCAMRQDSECSFCSSKAFIILTCFLKRTLSYVFI